MGYWEVSGGAWGLKGLIDLSDAVRSWELGGWGEEG